MDIWESITLNLRITTQIRLKPSAFPSPIPFPSHHHSEFSVYRSYTCKTNLLLVVILLKGTVLFSTLEFYDMRFNVEINLC